MFSDTLESVPSGVELVRSRGAAAVVSRLKDEIEGLALGGAGLAASLLDLIDEFQLVVLPVVVGAGKPFFPAGVSSHSVWSTNRCSIRGPCTSHEAVVGPSTALRSRSMRIGILTGGGDVPGLNACIKAVVNRAAEEGASVVGIRRGWGGLAHFNPEDAKSNGDLLISLDPGVVRTIDRTGGTFLHTSRTNPGKMRPEEVPAFLGDKSGEEGIIDITPHVLGVLEDQKIDVLIPIGGDDTCLMGSVSTRKGCRSSPSPRRWTTTSTAPTIASGSQRRSRCGVQFIHSLQTAAGSHERIAVVGCSAGTAARRHW